MVTLRKFDTSQVVGGLAYDERTKARAHEIEALRRAQTTLEDVSRARAATCWRSSSEGVAVMRAVSDVDRQTLGLDLRFII